MLVSASMMQDWATRAREVPLHADSWLAEYADLDAEVASSCANFDVGSLDDNADPKP